MTARPRRRAAGALAAAALVGAAAAHASTYLPLSDEDLLSRSPLVVMGRVVRVTPRVAADGLIESVAEIEAVRVLKGRGGPVVKVVVPGGEKDGRVSIAFGAPSLQVGEESILFLAPRPDGTFGLTELGLSKFELLEDPRGRLFATRSMFLSGAEPLGGVAGRPRTAETVRPLEEFLAFVESGAGRSLAGDGVVVQPSGPLAPRPGRPRPLWLEISIGYPIRWNWNPGGDPPTTVVYTPASGQANLDDGSDGTARAGAAVSSWKNVPGTDIRTTDPVVGTAGKTVIHLNDATSGSTLAFTGPICPATEGGILGLTLVNATIGDQTFRGRTYDTMLQAVVYIRAYSCRTSSALFDQTMAHEFGHTLGLAHSDQGISPEDPDRDPFSPAHCLAIMRACVGNCGGGCAGVNNLRSPLAFGTDDVAAVQYTYPIVPLPARAPRLVPIALDVATSSAHFTTEMTLTNRGPSAADVTLLYTPSLGTKEGGGSVTDRLDPGAQRVVPDAIAYLREKGLAIPTSGPQGGTLLVTFEGMAFEDDVSITARTTSATAAPQPVGAAGLAYAALRPDQAATSRLAVYGLRANATDRSNLAIVNASGDPLTVKVTAYSGDADHTSVVVADALSLPPYGWHQFSGVLASAGLANGWVAIDRVSATGSFTAYGVVNDNGTSDGSYIAPAASVAFAASLTVPVIVEAGSFVTELVAANGGTEPAVLTLSYVESLSPGLGPGGTATMTLAPGEQRIIPGAVDFFRKGGASVGAPGAGGYAGSVQVEVSGVSASVVFVGARTASRSPAGGSFGLFAPGVISGQGAEDTAYIHGLRADENNRSNVAVLNAGVRFSGPVTLSLQAYDGDAGGVPRGSEVQVTLPLGHWSQQDDFLAKQGVRNGWVKITRISGGAPWIAYGVINDGRSPGDRTGDGAFVPMSR